WPSSLVAIPLLLLLYHRRFDGGDLDPFPWFSGARGEQAVAKVLVGLEEDGYRCLHDVETGHGNIDQVGYVTVLESADLPAFPRARRGRTLSEQEVVHSLAAVL